MFKVKVCSYIAQYPFHWTAQSASHFTPWQTCSFRYQCNFSGKYSIYCANTIHSQTHSSLWTGTHVELLSELRHRGENGNPQTLKTDQQGFKPRLSQLRLRVPHSATEQPCSSVACHNTFHRSHLLN